MFGFLIALLSGALMSIQGVLNTGLTRQTGIWLSAEDAGLLTPLRTALVHGCRWNTWRFYHLDRHPQHGRAGPRKSHAFYCSDPDHHCLHY